MTKDTHAAFLLKGLSRRHVLQIGSGIGALAASGAIQAQTTYPARAVHVLLGFAAGGSSDAIGRLICQRLSEKLPSTSRASSCARARPRCTWSRAAAAA